MIFPSEHALTLAISYCFASNKKGFQPYGLAIVVGAVEAAPRTPVPGWNCAPGGA